ncbi:hypothetical protein Enr17x_34140 [Gimesia fumaroli]|uniref:Uncharacterized protein n=1 Tax=Gimesia fumaroli TaxID=2527976 RepID=A0A518IE63_9PLAN|nr:hypothetical protein Enr17x_34140 [Gimesia fumaroli]
MTGIRSRTQRAFFSLFSGDFEPFSTPQAVDPFQVHLPASRLHHPADTAIPETGVSPYQLQDLFQQSGFTIRWSRLIALTGTGLIHQLTGFAF